MKVKTNRENKAVDAMPTDARLFGFGTIKINDFRLGSLPEVGIASL
ncbi:hypothetical protein QEH56_24305 [Pelagicoccus enzymogenes]|nr:hypothetical protein [Pelagicoccus enzymogenes]MDQ8201304.1 hypothetical protein [Pelagicoccus enzymogenes]